jgi:hypothetical protein
MNMKNRKVRIGIWINDHDIMGKAIRFLTHGLGTHAAFIRHDDTIVENFYPHVRLRAFKPKERKFVEVYELDGLTQAESDKLERWLDDQLDHPVSYSIRDLFRYALNWPPIQGNRCFCSMFVLRGLRENVSYRKQPLVRLPYEDYASPRDLRLSPLLKLEIREGLSTK